MANTASITELYRPLDEAEVGSKHWLTVITAGMGFFTDAYDLFIIGTVTVLLTLIFHLSTGQISLLNSILLLASVAGALVFGKLMDRLGRKRMYGLDVAILVVGAILSAFAWSFTSLLLFRILIGVGVGVGVGVGGDYATSAVITSEYANKKARGRLVGTVFAMQGGLQPVARDVLPSTRRDLTGTEPPLSTSPARLARQGPREPVRLDRGRSTALREAPECGSTRQSAPLQLATGTLSRRSGPGNYPLTFGIACLRVSLASKSARADSIRSMLS